MMDKPIRTKLNFVSVYCEGSLTSSFTLRIGVEVRDGDEVDNIGPPMTPGAIEPVIG